MQAVGWGFTSECCCCAKFSKQAWGELLKALEKYILTSSCIRNVANPCALADRSLCSRYVWILPQKGLAPNHLAVILVILDFFFFSVLLYELYRNSYFYISSILPLRVGYSICYHFSLPTLILFYSINITNYLTSECLAVQSRLSVYLMPKLLVVWLISPDHSSIWVFLL